jgi:hypothetical protein
MVWSNQQTDQIVIPAGATSGARLVIDQNGVIVYGVNNEIVAAMVGGGAASLPASNGSPVVLGGEIAGSTGTIDWIDQSTGFFALCNLIGTFLSMSWDTSHQDVILSESIGLRLQRQAVKGGIRLGSGLIGNAYDEQWDFLNFSLPNGAQTTLTPQNQVNFDSDYPTGWVGNTWTCPVTSWWIFDLELDPWGAAATRCNARFLVNGVIRRGIDITAAANITGGGITMVRRLTAGDTVQCSAFQASGAAQVQTATSRISILRWPM